MKKINWIILVCILLTLFAWNWQPVLVFDYLAFSGENLIEGRVWTLLTALFLHADLLHLVGNMVFLYIFGNTIEEEIGPEKTLSAFFMGGVLSFLASTVFYAKDTQIVGASAAIFTLTALVMLCKPLKFSFFFLMPQGLVAIIYFTYNLVAVYLGFQGNVAYILHITGFTIGLPLGIAWSKDWVRNLLITIGLFLVYMLIIYSLSLLGIISISPSTG